MSYLWNSLRVIGIVLIGMITFAVAQDAVSPDTLDVHYSVPIISKPGRGLSFNYALGYDSWIWKSVPVNGVPTWQPTGSFGWTAQTQAQTGYIYVQVFQDNCYNGHTTIYFNEYTYKTYYDRQGVPHAMNAPTTAYDPCQPSLYPQTGTGTANDGSGYKFDVGLNSATVHSRDGLLVNAPLQTTPALGNVTDTNGNQISVDSTGRIFTDTLGSTVLSVSGAGTPSSPLVYSYMDTSGTTRSVTVNYSSLPVQTNFGCTTQNIHEFGPTTVNLVSSIVYPDNTSYTFTYEPTPGYSGSYTGRIASVTLPTSGVMTYSYTDSNNGIICSDGTTAGLKRTMGTNPSTDPTTVYVRSGSGTDWTTTITPPDGNDIVATYQEDSASSKFYETKRTNYSGSSVATSPIVVGSVTTCYNGAALPCAGAAITQPIEVTRTTVYPTLVNGYQSETDTYFNGLGLVTAVYEYDFGSGSPGSLLRQTITNYANLSGYASDRPSDVTVYDGSSHQVAQTSFQYDTTSLTTTSGVPQHTSVSTARGNASAISIWLNLPTATTLTTTNWYDDTGNLIQTQDPGGHNTLFSYTDNWTQCGTAANPTSTFAYVTQVTNHLNQQAQMAYYPCTGQVHFAKDQNDISASRNGVTTYYDSMLRPSAVYFPDGGSMGNNYVNANEVEQTRQINGSLSTDSYVLVDGYGRTSRTASMNGEASPGNFDQQDTSYDNMGRVRFVSYSYQGSGLGSAKVTSGAGDTLTYSFAGSSNNIARVTTIHSDSTTAYHDVYGRSILDTDEGTGSGTTRIQRMSQVDGLGRTLAVCEVSGTTQQGTDARTASCGLDTSGSGFLTSYTYDPLGNLLTVSQANPNITIAPHTRTFTYDSLSRLLSQIVPESGTTSYTYDADGNMLTRQRSKPNQIGNATVTTTYAYDALHRPTLITYDSLNPAVHFYYDSTTFAGITGIQNPVGRLIARGAADTFNDCGACDVLSYDSMGRVTTNWQRMSGAGSFITLSYGRDYLGNVTSFTDGASVNYSETYNQAARLTGISTSYHPDANHPATLISNIHYGPFGMISTSLGNTKSESMAYSARGQYTQLSVPGVYSFTIPTSGGFAPNGNVLQASDDFNGSWTYTYDDFNRLSSATMNSTNTYTYQYDRYGNRANTILNNVTQQQLSFQANNQIASGNGVSYDAAGNVISDSVGGTNRAYTYDAENRVLTVGGMTYKYDALGRRIQKTDATGNHWDEYYDLNGRIVTEYYNLGWARGEIYAGGRHLATYVAGTTIFHSTDWLGNERANTDPTGARLQSCSNLPFGDGMNCTTPLYGYPNAYHLFTGDEHDAESNTEHTDFRQLTTTQGRWLSPDPYMGSMSIGDPQSFNRYAYALNDPVDYSDPSGLDPNCNSPQSCAAYYTNFSTHWAGASAPSGFGWTQLTLVGWSLSNPQQVPTGNWVLTPILTGTNANGAGFSVVTELPEMTTVYPGIPFLTPIGGGYETSSGVGGGGGGNPAGGGSTIGNIASKVCSAIPDAGTVSAGYNGGIVWSPADFNVSATANGVSGELTFSLYGTESMGVLAPGAAVGVSSSWKAPNNSTLLNSSAPTYNFGIERTGITISPGTKTFGATFGPSFSPVTISRTTPIPISHSFTIPYLGYLSAPAKAVCTFTLGD